jgi:hypothetical protein
MEDLPFIPFSRRRGKRGGYKFIANCKYGKLIRGLYLGIPATVNDYPQLYFNFED